MVEDEARAGAAAAVVVVVISTNGGIEGSELQEAGGGPVAQRGAGTGDQQPGDEPPAQLQGLVADGVHAVVEPAQPPREIRRSIAPRVSPSAASCRGRRRRPAASATAAIASSGDRLHVEIIYVMNFVHQRSGSMPPVSTRAGRGRPRVAESAHFHGIAATDGPTSSMPAVLRPGLLQGVGVTVVGAAAEVRARARGARRDRKGTTCSCTRPTRRPTPTASARRSTAPGTRSAPTCCRRSGATA